MKNTLKSHTDLERGGILFSFEGITFDCTRIFWVSNVPQGGIRGGHAHIDCIQCFICLEGSVEVFLDDTIQQKTILLEKGDYIYVDALMWASEKFITDNSVLLVLCSHLYNKNDYIHTIADLEKYIKNGIK